MTTWWWGRIDARYKVLRLHLWQQVGDNYIRICSDRHYHPTRIEPDSEGDRCKHCEREARARGIEKAEQYQKFMLTEGEK